MLFPTAAPTPATTPTPSRVPAPARRPTLRTRLATALLLVLTLPGPVALLAPAHAAGVVRAFTIRDTVPDVVLGAADADGTRRLEVELRRTEYAHLSVRGGDRLRVRARIREARPVDTAYRQGLTVEAWRSPKGKPPRLIGYAVVFDRSSGVWATRADGRTAPCPRARRTRGIAGDHLSVTLPAACLKLRGRVKLVTTTHLDAMGPAGWGRAATDRSVLSRALRYPRRLR